MTLLYVMLAGAVGSGARYLVAITFPHGTIIVNLLGCFVFGAVAQFSTAGNWSPELRAAIAAGLLGGFTTYSAFNQETLTLLANGAPGSAMTNVAITLLGGLAAGSLGSIIAQALTR